MNKPANVIGFRPMAEISEALEVHCCICGRWGSCPIRREFGSKYPLFACEGDCLREATRRIRKKIPMADISKALLVEGWMTPDELYWLANHAAEHKVIVEFGCYYGRSTRALADHCPGTVYAVDNWEMLWEANKTFPAFQKNMVGTKARVVPVIANHAEIEHWIYKRPTMAFIDGDHRYDYASRDIEFWKIWMAKPGLICGHDSGMTDVERAVGELLPNAKVAPNTTIWYANI